MLFTIAIIVVVVLLAVALLPVTKRVPEQLRQASPVAFLTPEPTQSAQPLRQTTLRQQQLDEESGAVASEYQRRADAVWLEEVRGKASKLLANTTTGTKAKSE